MSWFSIPSALAQILHILTGKNGIADVQAKQATQLSAIEGKLNAMAHTIDETLAAVTDEEAKTDKLIALANGLEVQLKDALAGMTVPPAIQAKIDAVFDSVTNNAAKVQTALDAGVTPAP